MNIEEDFRFDVRIQKRLIKKGLVQESELESRLASLPDMEGQSEAVEVEQPGITSLRQSAEADSP